MKCHMCKKEMKFKKQEKIPNREGLDFKGKISDFWECSCEFVFFEPDEEDLEYLEKIRKN